MKINKFTTIVLTVIAINLSISTIKDLELIPTVHATEVKSDHSFLSNMDYGLVPLNKDGTISVKLSPNSEVDVNIVGINTSDELEVDIAEISTRDELDVNIDEIGGGYVRSGGPIW